MDFCRQLPDILSRWTVKFIEIKFSIFIWIFALVQLKSHNLLCTMLMEMRQQLCVALLRSQKMTTMALPIRYNGIFNFRASRCYEKNCEKSMLIVHVFIFIDFVSIFAFNQLAFAFTDTISSLKIHTFAMTLWQKHSFSNINTQVNICCQIWANKTGIYWNSVDSDLSKNSKEVRKKFDRE